MRRIVFLKKVLDFRVEKFGTRHPKTLQASQLLDAEVAKEQLRIMKG